MAMTSMRPSSLFVVGLVLLGLFGSQVGSQITDLPLLPGPGPIRNPTDPPAANVTSPPAANVTTNGTAPPPPLNATRPPPPLNTTSPPNSTTPPSPPLPTDRWAQLVANITRGVASGAPVSVLLPADTFRVTQTLVLNYTGTASPGVFALIGQGPDTVLDCNGTTRALAVFGAANITIRDLTIRNCAVTAGSGRGGGAAYIEVGGPLTITGVSFDGNTARNVTTIEGIGGSLYLSTPVPVPVTPLPVLIQDCTFSDSYARWGAGVVALEINANLRIDSCIFEGNTAENYGGGAYIDSITGSAVVTNSVFLYNSVNRATTGAGGLYVGSTTANVTISSCTFTQNQVPGFGAGLFIDSIPLTGSVAVVDSTFSFNVAQYGGAAVADTCNGTVTFTGCTFSKNAARRFGGAFDAFNTTQLAIVGSTFTSNFANASGGALAISTDVLSSLRIQDSTFSSNSVGSAGGAIWIGDSNFTAATISGNVFSFNTASELGGAILAVRNTGPWNLTDNVYNKNRAVSNGGAILMWNSTASYAIANSILQGNTARACPNLQGFNAPLINTTGLTVLPADANLAACLVTGSSTTQSVRQEVMSAKTLSVQDELAGLQRVRRLR